MDCGWNGGGGEDQGPASGHRGGGAKGGHRVRSKGTGSASEYGGVLGWCCGEGWCRGGGDGSRHQADALSEVAGGEAG